MSWLPMPSLCEASFFLSCWSPVCICPILLSVSVSLSDCSMSSSSQCVLTAGHHDPVGLLLPKRKESEVAQSCTALCHPMDCSLPGSSVHGILQPRILKGVAISFSGGSSQPRDRVPVPRTAGRRFVV